MAIAVTFDNIHKRYGPTVAVDEVSLSIEPGELFFFLGPSGCGKTTLLRILAGLVKPNRGRVLLGSRDVTDLTPQQRPTAMVFQNYALWPHMTVEENVAFGLRVRRVSRAERKSRVAEALRAVRMEALGQRKPAQLSGGQQQRVALARAIVVRPQVILLDEPLSNLDAKLRVEMREEIRRICKQSELTAVYVTHDQREAMAVADRMAIFHDGRVVQVGTPDELYSRPRELAVADFLGTVNAIPARVRAENGTTIELESGIGPIVVNGPAPTGATNGSILACFRPEAVRLVSRQVDRNCFPASLVARYYQGDTYNFLLRTGGVDVRATAIASSRGDTGSEGQELYWALDPADVFLLAATHKE